MITLMLAISLVTPIQINQDLPNYNIEQLSYKIEQPTTSHRSEYFIKLDNQLRMLRKINTQA